MRLQPTMHQVEGRGFAALAEQLLRRRKLRRLAFERLMPAAGFLLATGLALLFANPNQILSRVGVSKTVVEVSGITACTLAAVILVIAFLAGLLARLPHYSQRLLTWWRERGHSRLQPIEVDLALLEQLQTLDQEAFRADATELDEFQRIRRLYPDTLRAWRTEPDGDIAGFYLFSGLRQSAVNALIEGKLTRAREIPEAGFAKSLSRAAGIYVHDVIAFQTRGRVPFTRGQIVGYLLGDLFTRIERGRSIRYILARPVTPDGRRQARRFGLQPLDIASPQSCIWYLDLDHFPRRIFRAGHRPTD